MWPNVMAMVAAVCEPDTGFEANCYITLQFCVGFVSKKKPRDYLSSHSSRPCLRRPQSTTTAPQPMRDVAKKTKEGEEMKKKEEEEEEEEKAPCAAVLG